ncbi:MAG: competence protein ComEA [Myxococcota bacterium]|jgi:competence protein ComEA
MLADRPVFRQRESAPAIRHRVTGMAVLLLLCAALLVARHTWLAQAPPPPAVVVEVIGDVPAPGFVTPSPVTIHAALSAAGLSPAGFIDAELSSGTRIVVEGGTLRLEPMDELLVFGLPIDLNTASSAALQSIPGIGESRAGAIIADRTERGDFDSIDALQRVSGIGPVTVEKLRPFVSVGAEPL